MSASFRSSFLALVVAVAAVSAGCIGASENKIDPPTGPTDPGAVDPGNTTLNDTLPDPNVPLAVHPFSGKTTGVGAASPNCFNTDTAQSSKQLDVTHPNASARLEIGYKPTGTGVGGRNNQNSIQVYVLDDVGNVSKTVSGSSPIVIDIEAAELAGSAKLTVYTYVCDGFAIDQAWNGAISFWSAAIPGNFTALEP